MSRISPRSPLTHRSRLALVTAAVAVGLLSGCGSTDATSTSSTGAEATTPGTSSPPATSPPMPSTTSPPPSPGPAPSSPPPTGGVPTSVTSRPEVEAAVADAAERAGVARAQVVPTSYQRVTWTDGSLGCPQKGMSYTQAEVEGEVLVVRASGTVLQYHARLGGPFIHCANPSAAYAPPP
ncbi:MAG: hypothetical protein ACRCY8_13400 [Dermatophilaceae bacterium]